MACLQNVSWFAPIDLVLYGVSCLFDIGILYIYW